LNPPFQTKLIISRRRSMSMCDVADTGAVERCRSATGTWTEVLPNAWFLWYAV